MKKQTVSAQITLWANRLIACILLLLLFTINWLLDWYCERRFLSADERWAIQCAFYCCAVAVGGALWLMEGLLRNILRQQVFIRENVRKIQWIAICCALVSGICLPAAMVYYPLIFVVVIMAFLCLVVSVVAQVMDAAVSLREENDLTV